MKHIFLGCVQVKQLWPRTTVIIKWWHLEEHGLRLRVPILLPKSLFFNGHKSTVEVVLSSISRKRVWWRIGTFWSTVSFYFVVVTLLNIISSCKWQIISRELHERKPEIFRHSILHLFVFIALIFSICTFTYSVYNPEKQW